MTRSSDLPLDGIKVVDFTTLLPGPLAALILAEAGAQVIKIERPGGEEMRRYPPQTEDGSALYQMLNAGKDVVFADLKSDEGRQMAIDLVRDADVVVEQFRPGVMDRLGLGFEALEAVNPGLVYCAISGYGQSGPLAQKAGHDLNYIGDTGLLALGAPAVPPALIADIGGGTFPAVMNILMALLRRERTGRGAFIDIAMTDAMFTFAWWAYAGGVAAGEWAAPGKGLLAGGSPRYRLYPASDGAFVAVAALENKFWARLTAAVGLPSDLADDRRGPEATATALGRIIAGRTATEWAPIFEAADCCTTIVRSLDDAIRHPHFCQRGLFDGEVLTQGGKTWPALPVPVVRPFRRGGSRKAPR